MRIISGRFRRRLLLTSPGQTTRPITDRVKESLFERIEGSLKQSRVADIFAGTGTIGLEALSRGARSVVFIEQDRQAYGLLLQNVASLEAGDDTICWRTDAIRSSFRPHGGDEFRPYDVVFFDPPFPMIAGLRAGSPLYKALQRLTRPDVSAANARLVLRVPEHSRFDLPREWVLDWTLTLSNMDVHVYTKSTPDPAQTETLDDADPLAIADDAP